MALEKSITDRILKYLNEEVPNCIAEKVAGNSGQSGRADINGCCLGVNFRIEVKTADNGNKATPKQILNLRQWAIAGAVAFVAYSLKDVKEVFLDGRSLKCLKCSAYDKKESWYTPSWCCVEYCAHRGE